MTVMSGLQVQLSAFSLSVRTAERVERVHFRSWTVRGFTSGWLARFFNQRRALTRAGDSLIERVTQTSRGAECSSSSLHDVFNYWQLLCALINVDDMYIVEASTNASLRTCRRRWYGPDWVTVGTLITTHAPGVEGASPTRGKPDITTLPPRIQLHHYHYHTQSVIQCDDYYNYRQVMSPC